MGTDHHAIHPVDAAQRRSLKQVLLINVALAAGLGIAGLVADSSGLIANALDNTSDALAYGLSFLAVTRPQAWRTGAATLTGIMLLVLAVAVLADATRRFLTGSEPLGLVMIVAALAAAAANALCVLLLHRQRADDVNLRAAWTMSVNDFVSNFGIVVAGGLVILLDRNWPDLAVAGAIALVAGYGGVKTLHDAARSRDDDSHAGHSHG